MVSEEKVALEDISAKDVAVAVSFEKREEEPFLLDENRKGEDAPADARNLVYWIILLHGVGTLMPWNMFLTIAQSYYVDFKFMEPGANNTMLQTVYSRNFLSLLGVFSQIPNLVLNFLNIFVTIKGDLTKRISISLLIVGFVVLFTMSFIYMETASWMGGFFVLTLASAVLLNGANGIYQNSIFGLASDFPFKYTNAVIIGNNLCGTFVSVLSIATLFLSESVQNAAFSYFGISLLTIVCCFASFFVLKKLPYYRYFAEKKVSASVEDIPKDEEPVESGFRQFILAFQEGYPQMMNVFLVFFVTLTIFPSMMVDIRPEADSAIADFIGDKLYVSVTTFLLFNLFAFIGSMLANVVQVPGPEKLWMLTAPRVVLIPLFAVMNYRPVTRSLPVLFHSTPFFLVCGIFMSVSSGYLSSLSMMYAPRGVSPSRVRTVCMMAAFFLIFGIVAGLLFSMVVASFVDRIGN